MVVYWCRWRLEDDFSNGSGKIKERYFSFSVLCRTSADALATLRYYFDHEYKNHNNVCFDDGVIEMMRAKIDSRGFNATYLMMDGIREPLLLSNLKSNLLRLDKIF